MKTIFSLLFILILVQPSHSQHSISESQTYFDTDDRRTETLLTRGTSYGGFGSFVYGVSEINGQSVYLTGRRFALVINVRPQHTLNIGVGSYKSRSSFDPSSWNISGIPQPEMEMEYSGFELEYVNRTRKLFHFGTQILVGSGSVEYDNRTLPVDRTKDTYFVVQPGLNLNLNVTSWLRFNLSGYYRFASNVNLAGTSDKELSGFSALLGFRIGAF